MKRTIALARFLFTIGFFVASGVAQKATRTHTLVSGTHSTGYLGVGLIDVDDDRAKVLKLKDTHGAEISMVQNDSPASKAGLKESDVVLEFNGQRIESVEQMIRMVRETPPNRKVSLLISRGGATQTVSVTMIAHSETLGFNNNFHFNIPDTPDIDAPDMTIPSMPRMPPMPPSQDLPRIRIPDSPRTVLSWQNRTLGVEAESLNSQLADYFGVKSGVLVRLVSKNSAAERGGLKAGDVVTRVNGTNVASPQELSSQLQSGRNKASSTLSITRNHRELTIEVKSALTWNRDDSDDR